MPFAHQEQVNWLCTVRERLLNAKTAMEDYENNKVNVKYNTCRRVTRIEGVMRERNIFIKHKRPEYHKLKLTPTNQKNTERYRNIFREECHSIIRRKCLPRLR